jgi:hypothetical protein
MAGIGAGIWLSQHFALRQEFRYQTYEDGLNRKLDLMVATTSLGFML